jgi:hypothetical protein
MARGPGNCSNSHIEDSQYELHEKQGRKMKEVKGCGGEEFESDEEMASASLRLRGGNEDDA